MMSGFDPAKLQDFPTLPGVYLMKDKRGAVLYVGKAKRLRHRLKAYFATTEDRAMVPFLLSHVHTIDTIVVPSETEALLLENTLIKKHQPKYNALLKDDKTYASLWINHRHTWPAVQLVRYKGKPREQGTSIGPYPSAHVAKETLEALLRLFPLRQCSDAELKRRTRPCLLYSMKRCVAPCVQKCTKEEYDALVRGAIRFLKGQDQEIRHMLIQQMHEASAKLEFERAAILHRAISHMKDTTEHRQVVAKATGKNTDVLAIYRQGHDLLLAQLFWREGKLVDSTQYRFHEIAQEDGELFASFILQHYPVAEVLPQEILLSCPLPNAQALIEALETSLGKSPALLHPRQGEKWRLVQIALENAKALFRQNVDACALQEHNLVALTEILCLTRYPKHIICVDTSHHAGGAHVAAIASFMEGKKDRTRTRFYRIRETQPGDDYGALHEALTRYLRKAKEHDDLPDLLIVDGGKGQLQIALEASQALDIASIDIIAVAKEHARHDKGLTLERVYIPDKETPIQLSRHSPALFLLQNIRDAAHQLALGFHRKQHRRRTTASILDAIPGIGPVKKHRLLQHFGSVKKILMATEEELIQVPGIQQRDIRALQLLRSQQPSSGAP